MNKYRDKSDFEINKAVAEIIHHGKIFTQAYSFGDICGNSVQWIGGYAEYIHVDFCKDPADAMPIIIENGISLINSDGVHFAAAPGCGIEGYLGGDTVGYGSRKYSENENIYRAAMEVFLMMKDAENES
ncbi:phage protein NinX family protein [Morganella morganii]|uniref:phage protein NinX family protein n=1 Tax=Morganella morganii TaxID=582 RepID=UPI0033162473